MKKLEKKRQRNQREGENEVIDESDLRSHNNHLTGLCLSSTMYLSGILRPLRALIFSSLIFSTKFFWAYQVSLNFLFSTSFTFFPNSVFSYFSTICFLSSLACFLRSYFLSFSSCYSISFSYLCFLTAESNSAFSAFACSSSLLSFSSCCSRRASWSSFALLALC